MRTTTTPTTPTPTITTIPTPDHAGAVLVMAASTRDGSINRALAEAIASRLGTPSPAVLVDLREHTMPLYDGDLEAREGVPAAAHTVAALLAMADVLIIVSPEYNGAFTPLLKNTLDWVTRVDMGALSHLRVHVATASPGAGGGAKAAEITAAWLANMGVDVSGEHLCVANASIDARGALVGLDDVALQRFVSVARGQRSAA